MAVRHYEIEFTTKGPVHIGNGEKYGKKDYFRSGKKVAVLDVRKFIAKMTPDQVSDYCKFLEKEDRNATLQAYLEGDKALMALAEDSVLYRADTDLATARRGSILYHDVWEFVRDAEGRPYIPGSSVKGMIRTALLTCLLLDDPGYRGLFDSAKVRGKDKNADSAIDGRAFWREALDGRKPEELTDIMRYVSVSDSEPLAISDLVFAKKYDRFSKGDEGLHKKNMGNISSKSFYEGNELNIYRESIRPDTHFTVSVDVDDRIDQYISPIVFDAEGIKNVLERSFRLYKECFLDRFAEGDEGSSNGGAADGKCRYVIADGPFAGRRCTNHAVDGTGYCNTHKDKAGEASSSSVITCYLGGGVDFDSKTVVNALFSDELERLAEVSGILYSQFPTRIDFSLHPELVEEVREAGFSPISMRASYKGGRLTKGKDDHRHWKEVELGVSPHTMKFGIVGKNRFPMGKCTVQIKERRV